MVNRPLDKSRAIKELEYKAENVRDIITCIAWGADGTLLATGGVGGSVTIWEKHEDMFKVECLKPTEYEEDIHIKAINDHRWCFDKSGD